MKQLKQKCGRPLSRSREGMALIAVVMALAITGLVVGGIFTGYTFCSTSPEQAALALAASAPAQERIEESRSAKWETASSAGDHMVAANTCSGEA